jgi:uncharacterized protein YutE (UPF0331/DUF86 family)
MPISSESREHAILERLRDQYEHQGYSFYTHPSRELLPTFLGQYRPDAVALKGDEGIIIEIKGRANKTELRLSEITRLFAGQTKWRFSIVNVDDFPGEELIRLYSPDRIEKALQEAQQLSQTGHTRAAFVLAWAAWEAAGRILLAPDTEPGVSPLSPTQMTQMLTQDSFLDEASARRLWNLARIRSAVVHGDLDKEVDQEAVTFLIAIARHLLEQHG